MSAATAATNRPAGTATASGFPTSGCSGNSGWGSTADNTTSNTGAATATLAHHRQRGEGSDPVGVSSSTKPAHDSQMGAVLSVNPAR